MPSTVPRKKPGLPLSAKMNALAAPNAFRHAPSMPSLAPQSTCIPSLPMSAQAVIYALNPALLIASTWWRASRGFPTGTGLCPHQVAVH